MLTSNPNKVRIHSQKIVPGLEAFNHIGNVKPGPEQSEGAPSQKIGRELTPHKGSASNLKYLTRVRNVNVESEQSEDSLTRGR
ncbi:MAG: hypothetical protein ACLP2U_11500, partial [Syntrophobacteraceae bacterium]